MARIGFATKLLIPPGANDPRIKARIGIWHVDAGNAESLADYFRYRSGGIESHGFVKKNGVLEQYRDTAFQADANYLANDFALSFETQGFGEGLWTDEQLETMKRTMLWCRREHGIPLRLVTSWDDPKGGWGYHTLFGAPSQWTPVAKSCPGPGRIRQFHEIIVPWMRADGKTPAPEKPTVNITTALQADTVEEKVAALQKVVKHGTDEASQAAMEYIDALRRLEKVRKRVHAARVDLKEEEVRK